MKARVSLVIATSLALWLFVSGRAYWTNGPR